MRHRAPNPRGWSVLLFVFSLAALVSSCGSDGGGDGSTGGGGGSPTVDDPIITRVEITPGSVMLGALGESYPLTAQAFNAAGLEVDAEFAWTSSHPENLSVDAEGLLTAMGALGSSLITAEAEGVQSIPATVLVVVPAPNSQFVDDNQVVGDFALVDPDAEFVPGVLYTVTLTGIDPPPIGTILLGREEAPVGGKVVDAQVTNGEVVVTLELLTLDELFAELKIDQIYDLSNVEALISEAAADFYAMERQQDGSYLFTVLPNAPVDEKAEFPLGPFECKTTLPIVPLTFDALPLTFGLTVDLDFIVDYDSSQGGLQKIAVKGSAKAAFKVSPTISVALDAKIECMMDLLTLTVPIGGPLALIFGGQIPVGAGFEVGGKITIAQVGAEVSTEASATAEIGVQCPGGSNCTMLNTLSSDTKADYKWVLPNGANLDSQLRLELSLSGFLFIKMAIGNRFFRALRFDAFIIKGGLTQAANLSSVGAQVADTGYASDYKLTLDLSAGVARDAEKLFKLLNVNVTKLEIKTSLVLFSSPKATTITADVASFEMGDTVTFDVKLNPTTVDYLSLTTGTAYNIDDIIIYRKIDLGGGTIDVQEVARTTATLPFQSDFTLTSVATEAGDAADNFFAFVETTALSVPFSNGLGFPFLDELELGKAAAGAVPGLDKIAFSSERDGNVEVYVMDADGSNPQRLTNSPSSTDRDPAWSPDRTKIAFESNRDGNDEVYLMNADGSNPQRLTNTATHNFDPAWSP